MKASALFAALCVPLLLASIALGNEPPGKAECKKCECKKCECKAAEVCPGHDFSGIYHTRSVDADGKVSYGVCVITQDENLIIFNWAARASSTVGIALRTKDTLAVTWKSFVPGGVVQGGTLYTVHDGGKRLEGKWLTMPSDGQPRTETLRFIRKTEETER